MLFARRVRCYTFTTHSWRWELLWSEVVIFGEGCPVASRTWVGVSSKDASLELDAVCKHSTNFHRCSVACAFAQRATRRCAGVETKRALW